MMLLTGEPCLLTAYARCCPRGYRLTGRPRAKYGDEHQGACVREGVLLGRGPARRAELCYGRAGARPTLRWRPGSVLRPCGQPARARGREGTRRLPAAAGGGV